MTDSIEHGIGIAIVALVVVVGGCSHTADLSVYADVAVPSRPVGCSVVMGGEFADFPVGCVHVADLSYRGAPLELACEREDVRALARERACEVGATHVRVRFTEQCHAARAEYLACPLVTSSSGTGR